MGGPIDMEPKGCESIGYETHIVTLKCDLTHDLDLGFWRPIFLNFCISGMGGPINMER